MTDLNPLIRVRKHATEQKQKLLAELYRQADELETQKQTLLDQLEEERAAYADMPIDFLSYFAPYEQAVKDRVEDISADQEKLERRITSAREDMRLAFAELKKIEIIQNRRIEEQGDALARKEAQELDEIGIDGYRRKNDEA